MYILTDINTTYTINLRVYVHLTNLFRLIVYIMERMNKKHDFHKY